VGSDRGVPPSPRTLVQTWHPYDECEQRITRVVRITTKLDDTVSGLGGGASKLLSRGMQQLFAASPFSFYSICFITGLLRVISFVFWGPGGLTWVRGDIVN